jgi:hypothetical protein
MIYVVPSAVSLRLTLPQLLSNGNWRLSVGCALLGGGGFVANEQKVQHGIPAAN